MMPGFQPHKALWVALMFFCGATHAAESRVDPEKTRIALHALMQVANITVPSSSSCHGKYDGSKKPTVGHVLSMQLAYLSNGDNHIAGDCIDTHCHIRIRHAFGEDVSSADIRFEVRNGKANVSTLQCVITP